MKIDYADKYKKTLDTILAQVHDIMLAYKDGQKSNAQYQIIPFTKDGKQFIRYDVINMETKELTSMFYSNKTIGVKLYDSEHNYKCYYSVSQKNNIQVIQVDYADGTGIEQTYIKDNKTNKYMLTETLEIIPASDIIDLYDYTDQVVNEDLLLCCIYQKDSNMNLIRFSTSYSNAELLSESNKYYNFDEHPELHSISSSLRNYSMEFICNYLNAGVALDPSNFYKETGAFILTFNKMIKKMKNQQNKANPSDIDAENR